jgi:hypothetical protein
MLTSVQSRPWVQRSLLIACFIAVAAHGYVITYLRPFPYRDFDVHREVGRRFLAGEYLYANGLCHPYMPIAAFTSPRLHGSIGESAWHFDIPPL